MTNLKKQAQRTRDGEIYKLSRLGTPCHPPDRTSWGGRGTRPIEPDGGHPSRKEAKEEIGGDSQ